MPASVVTLNDVEWKRDSGIERRCQNFQPMSGDEIEVSVEIVYLSFHAMRAVAERPNSATELGESKR